MFFLKISNFNGIFVLKQYYLTFNFQNSIFYKKGVVYMNALNNLDDVSKKIISKTYDNQKICSFKITELPHTQIVDSVDEIPPDKEWSKECDHYVMKIAECDGLEVYHDVPYADFLVAEKETGQIVAHTQSNFINWNSSIRESSFEYNDSFYILSTEGLSKQVVDFAKLLNQDNENSPRP